MDVCRFSEARYRSQVFTPPCVQSSATPPPSLQVGLTLSSSFAPRPLSKLMALSLASVLNSRVSSRLFPWTNSKPWCLLTIYWLSGKRIATYHKVLPDSKKKKIEIFAENNCLWIHGLEMDAVSFNTYEAVIRCLLAVHSEPMRR